MRRFSLKFAFVILTFHLHVNTSTAQIAIENFSLGQGLPQSQVSCIDEDSLGYLWIGTLGGGLARFDGENFKNYSINEGLPNNFIRDIQVEKSNEIWIATQKGVSFFDGVHFKNFKTDPNGILFPVKILNKGDSLFFLNNNGELGVIIADSIYRNVKHSILKNVKKFLRPEKNLALVSQENENGRELVVVNNGIYRTIKTQGLYSAIYSSFTQGGELFISTNGGFFKLRGSELEKVGNWTFQIWGFDEVCGCFIGKDRSKVVTVKDNLKTELDEISPIVIVGYKDREGSLWLGSERGLYKLYIYPFTRILSEQINFTVTTVFQHKDEIWVGTTNRGVLVFKDNVLLRTYDFKEGAKNYIGSIREDNQGNLWVSSMGGMAKYSDGNFIFVKPDIIKGSYSFDFDNNNNLVVGNPRQGLYRIKESGEVTSFTEFQSIVVTPVRYNRDLNLFAIGTFSGLWILKDSEVSKVNLPEINNSEVSTLDWVDTNTLLVGTFGKGLFVYSLKDSSLARFDEANGLVSNTLFFLKKYGKGIWAGTEKGIDYLEIDYATNKILKIRHFGATDGLMGLETSSDAVYKANNGFYFGLVDGLYFLSDSVLIGEYSEPIHIDEVKLFYNQDGGTNAGSKIIESGHARTYSHEENHLTFNFNKINKRSPNSIYYRYKIQDYDKIWSLPSLSRSATYSNLIPGNYKFIVQATDKSGALIFDETSYAFTIQPAYYQMIAFKFIVALILVGLLAVFIDYFSKRKIRLAMYVQSVKEAEKAKLRKEIARDFHDELGNQVARMINYVGLLRISKKMEQDVYETLSGYSQTILTGAKDFVWALDPRNDDLQSTIIHLKDFAERMFSEKGIDFRFYGKLLTLKLPMGYSRQINLIFKEAMTNAFKHSRASSIEFKCDIVNDSQLIIILKDNGAGIGELDLLHSTRGLENMRARAAKIDAVVDIQSSNLGTSITFKSELHSKH